MRWASISYNFATEAAEPIGACRSLVWTLIINNLQMRPKLMVKIESSVALTGLSSRWAVYCTDRVDTHNQFNHINETQPLKIGTHADITMVVGGGGGRGWSASRQNQRDHYSKISWMFLEVSTSPSSETVLFNRFLKTFKFFPSNLHESCHFLRFLLK